MNRSALVSVLRFFFPGSKPMARPDRQGGRLIRLQHKRHKAPRQSGAVTLLMRRKQTAAVLLGSAISLAPLNSQAANHRTKFEARTDPSVAGPMIEGEWREKRRQAHLALTGGHPFPIGKTTFQGIWTTPFLKKKLRPSLYYVFNFQSVNDLDQLRLLEMSVRAHVKGRRWRKWDNFPLQFDPRMHSHGGDALHTLLLDTPRKVQFQWRIRGRIEGPALLEGDIDIRLQ